MKVMKWSVIALAVAAGTSQMALASSQSESEGFVEGSKLNLLNRNFYMNRDFRNGDPDKSYGEEWAHGFIGTFESGFTQGTVGVGFDAIGLLGVKLDNGRGRSEVIGALPYDSDGRARDDYSEFGAAVKLRVSDTVFKYGDQFTALPVFATDDSRLLPEVAEGLLITSNELEGLELNAGRFTALNAQNQSYHDSVGLKEANFIGGSYAFSDELSASLYYSDVEDNFRKYYANASYALPLSDTQSLAFDFNIYDTKSKGSEDSGEVDNIAWSLGATYSIAAHAFTLVHQRVTGDGDYAYGVDGGGTVFLGNSVQRSDFNAEGEKSWQARYDLDMAAYGVPGLSFMTRYVRGTDANVATTNNGKEWERNIEARYVVQDGAAKDLSLRVRQATYRSSDGVYYGSPSIDEVRLIVEYPLSIL
ncbi:OprD family porin [Pseudomonas songnenensis]|uniref:Outer membrane porin, OprD family n=1 Tax=Pseudomonas songnenensis TaxID=1176259 RepID=A0A482U3L7_9PSED|nr:OprD family porin [Pseudomonas songnenensis]RYJ61839.1 outer membrane porin, OprD family [Pseudomonas songnenensis]